jgi:anthranilate phosphoribosyltransferase
MDVKDIISTLVHTPDSFTACHAETMAEALANGETNDAQTAAYLTALRLQKLDTKPDIIAATSKVFYNYALKCTMEADVVDIVGTGGDGKDTFNVSTTAAIIAAGAGVKVAKVHLAPGLHDTTN